MTNKEYTVIIYLLDNNVRNEGKLILNLEADKEVVGKSPLSKGHLHLTFLKDTNMEELHVGLEQLTNYLIQLFYKSGKRYSCTRTKIGKLLSIIAFKYAREGKVLFDEKIYKYDGCGTTIAELSFFVDRDIYIQCEYYDSTEKAEIDCNNKIDDFPVKYSDINGITVEIKKNVDDVFRHFGSYAPNDLGKCINPLILYDGVVDDDGSVVLSRIRDLSRSDFCSKNLSITTLIEYLFS